MAIINTPNAIAAGVAGQELLASMETVGFRVIWRHWIFLDSPAIQAEGKICLAAAAAAEHRNGAAKALLQ